MNRSSLIMFSALSLLVGSVFLSLPFVLHAASFDLPNIPCPAGIDCASVSDADVATNPAAYIARFYQIALAIAGALAVAIIVAGSLFYTFAGGSTDRQREGKDMITSALWGIALLFGSYLILNTINPELVTLDIGDIDVVRPKVEKFDDPKATEDLQCSKEKIAEWAGPCNASATSTESARTCQKNLDKKYYEMVQDCQGENPGGGMFAFNLSNPAEKVICHPFYKDFAKKEAYNPQYDASKNNWKEGTWTFCSAL
jgi:hypothetical protein